MAEIRYADSVEIAAPPDRVFDYRLDYRNLAAYNPHVADVRRTDGGADPGAGATYTFALSLPGLDPIECPLRVVESVRPARIVHETGPGFIATEVCRFTPAESGTRADFEVIVAWPGEIGRDEAQVIEATGREQMRLELELLKKILES